MQHCLEILGVEAVQEPSLLGRGTNECWRSHKVAHHPFKDPVSFEACLAHQHSEEPQSHPPRAALPSYLRALGQKLFGSEVALQAVVERSVLVKVSFGSVAITLRMDVADNARQRLPAESNKDAYGLGTLQEAQPKAEELTGNVSGTLPWINIIDVGGNLGVVTIAAFKLYPTLSRVVVVEPIPTTYFFLRWNLWLNGVPEVDEASLASAGEAMPGVLALHRAVARNDEEKVSLCYEAANSMEARRRSERCARNVSVSGIAAESLLNLFGTQSVALVKMDCEGCELEGLPPFAKPNVRARVQRLAGELHGDCFVEQALEEVACAYDAGRYVLANECTKVRSLQCGTTSTETSEVMTAGTSG